MSDCREGDYSACQAAAMEYSLADTLYERGSQEAKSANFNEANAIAEMCDIATNTRRYKDCALAGELYEDAGSTAGAKLMHSKACEDGGISKSCEEYNRLREE